MRNRDEILATWETEGIYQDWYAIDAYNPMSGKIERIYVNNEDACTDMMRNVYSEPTEYAMGKFYRCSLISPSEALTYFNDETIELDERSAYTLTETAELLGISRQAVHKLIQHGKLDAHKVGNGWMVYRYSVENRRKNY